jgi:hypothetical protein
MLQKLLPGMRCSHEAWFMLASTTRVVHVPCRPGFCRYLYTVPSTQDVHLALYSGVCYNEQFLAIKSGCYNERGGILSADVHERAHDVSGPSRFD